MGFTVNFTDNQNVDSSSVNEIAENISEISGDSAYPAFSDGIVYGISALNSITQVLVTKGVSSGCDVVCSGLNVTISKGQAFFADGRRITIDDDGIKLTRPQNEKSYVWLLNDEVTGIVSAKCTKEEPSGDFIKLAEISQAGTVTPKKDVALMKNSSLLPNSYITQTVYFSKGTTGEREIPINGNYRRMILRTKGDMFFLDWDNLKLYRKYNLIEEYDLSVPGTLPSLLFGKDGYFGTLKVLSYENTVLKVDVTSNYQSNTLYIHCM